MGAAASIAMLVGGAILNATAFVGAGYIGQKVSSDDTKEELKNEGKRHDMAVEQFNKDKEAWAEHRDKVLDFIAKQKNLDFDARQDLMITDENLDLYEEYHPFHPTGEDLSFCSPELRSAGGVESKRLRKEPHFSDYYQPSSNMKSYQYIYLAGGGILLVYLLKKI